MRKLVPTLLGHIPSDSKGLKTSIIGRLAFVAAASWVTVRALRPDAALIGLHLTVAVAVSTYFLWFRSFRVLARKAVLFLAFACILVGFVNFIWASPYFQDGLRSRVAFGVSRSLAFGSLALSTLLLTAITRPSDHVRLIARHRLSPRTVCLISTPLTAVSSIVGSYHDTIVALRQEAAPLTAGRRWNWLVINAAVAILAQVLMRASFLFQGLEAFSCRGYDRMRYVVRASPILETRDLGFFLGAVVLLGAERLLWVQ